MGLAGRRPTLTGVDGTRIVGARRRGARRSARLGTARHRNLRGRSSALGPVRVPPPHRLDALHLLRR